MNSTGGILNVDFAVRECRRAHSKHEKVRENLSKQPIHAMHSTEVQGTGVVLGGRTLA